MTKLSPPIHPMKSPLHAWLADDLRQRILSGELEPGDMLAPESEFCETYGLSRGPVRQALAALVEEGLIHRIPGKGSFVRPREAATKPAIKEFTTARPAHVAVWVDSAGPDVPNFVFSEIVAGLNHAVSMSDGRCRLTCEFHRLQSVEDPFGQKFLQRDDCDALIVLPYARACVDFLRQVKTFSRPTAALFRWVDNPALNCFSVNHEQGAFTATNYLLRMGHRRIGLLLGSNIDASPSIQQRLQGYQRAVQQLGEDAFDPSLVTRATFQHRSIQCGIEYLLGLKPRPTAIMIGGEALMEGSLMSLARQRITIPDDLSLIAFDDRPFIRQHHPAISAVRMLLEEDAHLALETLLSQVEGTSRDIVRQASIPELIIRPSCRAIGDFLA